MTFTYHLMRTEDSMSAGTAYLLDRIDELERDLQRYRRRYYHARAQAAMWRNRCVQWRVGVGSPRGEKVR